MKKEIPQGFYFDDSLTAGGNKRHDYYLDGKKLTGVTTVLGTIAKPNLLQWYADMAVGSLGWLNPKYNSPEKAQEAARTELEGIKVLSVDEWIERLSKARLSANNRKEDTADLGTKVHAWIEGYINSEIEKLGTHHVPDDDIKGMCDKFVEWSIANVDKFLNSEKKMFSREMWLAGTCDFTFIGKDGRKYVGDIKTANAIYDRTYFAQTAAYRMMLEEMGETDFVGSWIVRCGKDGSFEAVASFDFETDKKIFLAAHDLYKLNKLN